MSLHFHLFVASDHVISVFKRVHQRFDLIELKSSGSNALFRKYLPIFQAKASEGRLPLKAKRIKITSKRIRFFRVTDWIKNLMDEISNLY
jgi:hypothetical protein